MVCRPFRNYASVSLLGLILSWAVFADGRDDDVVSQNCLGCHVPEEGGLSRINGQRKTPEGWQMTIHRMQTVHGLTVGNQNIPIGRSMKQLVKHLSDTQGLAPSEAAPYRYLIEQRLNHFEDFEPEMREMCGRCHSGGRVALQRRTKEEWDLVVHFHLGQFPTIEYQLYGRDREWVKQAFEETVPMLAEDYPFESDAWDEWQQAEKPDLSGTWVFSGHMAGKGYAHVVMTAAGEDDDNYKLTLAGSYASGESISGEGRAIVYTGYEWRGQVTVNGVSMRMVLAADADGNGMTGRLFEKQQVLIGMDVSATRDNGEAAIANVMPGFIGAGEEQVVTISGAGLAGDVSFGDGISVTEVLSADANHVSVRVKAAVDASAGAVSLSVGDAAGSIRVHGGIDAIAVEPAYAIARVGGNGPTHPLNAAFRAVAMSGDEMLGYMPSASWHVEPFNEMSAADNDVKFAGGMDAETGIYSPAGAGPNPERRMSTNNAGNLKVVASAGDLNAEAQLIVTVQVWITPPLR